MSFEILYHTCNLGTEKRQGRNPFTGEVRSEKVDNGLTQEERAGVLALLRSSGVLRTDESGFYSVDLPDGASVEVFAEKLEGPEKINVCIVTIWSLTPKLVAFLWQLCSVGNMAAMPAMVPAAVIVANETQRERVKSRWPDAVIASCPDEFGHLLSAGFGDWREYRDQVVRSAAPGLERT